MVRKLILPLSLSLIVFFNPFEPAPSAARTEAFSERHAFSSKKTGGTDTSTAQILLDIFNLGYELGASSYSSLNLSTVHATGKFDIKSEELKKYIIKSLVKSKNLRKEIVEFTGRSPATDFACDKLAEHIETLSGAGCGTNDFLRVSEDLSDLSGALLSDVEKNLGKHGSFNFRFGRWIAMALYGFNVGRLYLEEQYRSEIVENVDRFLDEFNALYPQRLVWENPFEKFLRLRKTYEKYHEKQTEFIMENTKKIQSLLERISVLRKSTKKRDIAEIKVLLERIKIIYRPELSSQNEYFVKLLPRVRVESGAVYFPGDVVSTLVDKNTFGKWKPPDALLDLLIGIAHLEKIDKNFRTMDEDSVIEEFNKARKSFRKSQTGGRGFEYAKDYLMYSTLREYAYYGRDKSKLRFLKSLIRKMKLIQDYTFLSAREKSILKLPLLKVDALRHSDNADTGYLKFVDFLEARSLFTEAFEYYETAKKYLANGKTDKAWKSIEQACLYADRFGMVSSSMQSMASRLYLEKCEIIADIYLSYIEISLRERKIVIGERKRKGILKKSDEYFNNALAYYKRSFNFPGTNRVIEDIKNLNFSGIKDALTSNRFDETGQLITRLCHIKIDGLIAEGSVDTALLLIEHTRVEPGAGDDPALLLKNAIKRGSHYLDIYKSTGGDVTKLLKVKRIFENEVYKTINPSELDRKTRINYWMLLGYIEEELFVRNTSNQLYRNNALKYYFEAKRFIYPGKEVDMAWRVYYHLGRIYEKSGSYKQAINHYKIAINYIEKQRINISSVESSMGFVSQDINNVYESIITLLVQCYNDKKNPLPDGFLQALDYVERNKSRAFNDILVSGSATGGKEKTEDKELKRRMREIIEARPLNSHQVREIFKKYPGAGDAIVEYYLTSGDTLYFWVITPDEIKFSSTVIDRELLNNFVDTICLIEEGDAVRSDIYIDATLTAHLIKKWPGFTAGEKNTIASIITQGAENYSTKTSVNDIINKMRSRGVASGENEIERQIGIYDLYSHLVYLDLFKPVERVLQNSTRLTIIPHSKIHLVPFQILKNRTDEYLIKKYEFVYSPSSTILSYTQRQNIGKYDWFSDRDNRKKILFIGTQDPVAAGLDPLRPQKVADALDTPVTVLCDDIKYSRGEYPADMYPTETRVKEFIREGYSIIHFHAHGEFNPENPLRSRIYLQGDEWNDGKFEVREIIGNKMESTYLVSLFSCEIGRPSVQTGDELIGLANAFLSAGAPSVIAAQIPLEEQSIHEISRLFYDFLYGRNKSGQNVERKRYSKSEALRKTQRTFYKKFDIHHNDPRRWGSLIFIGAR